MKGFVDTITADRTQVAGWAQLTTENKYPTIVAKLDGIHIGSVHYGAARADVSATITAPTCTFTAIFEEPLPGMALLSGDLQLVAINNSTEVPFATTLECLRREQARMASIIADILPPLPDAQPSSHLGVPPELMPRTAPATRHHEATPTILDHRRTELPEHVTELIQQALDRAVHQLVVEGIKQTRQVESLLQLNQHVPPDAPLMPTTGGFALDARSLLHLLKTVHNLLKTAQGQQPLTVLELGSGTSTVWLGHALKASGGHLVSLEHDEKYLLRTSKELDRHDLTSTVTLRHAPLTELTLRGERFFWYCPDQLRHLRQIDMVIVDGPPAAVGRSARYPAIDLVRGHLNRRALVMLHDADRAPEQEVIRRWLAENDRLRQIDEGVSNFATLLYADS